MEAMTENEFGEVLRRIVITIAAVCAVCITVGVGLYAMSTSATVGTVLGIVVIAMISYGAWRMYKIVAWVTQVPSEAKEAE